MRNSSSRSVLHERPLVINRGIHPAEWSARVSTATAIKERPIIFTGESVRAILSGAKTQTRRVMKPQPHEDCGAPYAVEVGEPEVAGRNGELEPGAPVFAAWWDDHHVRCPWEVGSRLWVKEAWCWLDESQDIVAWRDDFDPVGGDGILEWKPPMYLPRRHSRITLEVTGVKVERVQEISVTDCHAEGVSPTWDGEPYETETFAERWDSINGKKPGCAWSDNPRAWAISFRLLTQQPTPAANPPVGSEQRPAD